MNHSKVIAAALRAKKTDIKKVMASADLTLSQKALRGRSDVSQSIMCLRVANKLRELIYAYDIPMEVIHEQTGISMPTLLDIDCRSVLISIVKLAVAEIALDAFTLRVEKDHLAHLHHTNAYQATMQTASDKRFNKS
jgi:hypothetical protein